jgi:hypothetical protein
LPGGSLGSSIMMLSSATPVVRLVVVEAISEATFAVSGEPHRRSVFSTAGAAAAQSLTPLE